MTSKASNPGRMSGVISAGKNSAILLTTQLVSVLIRLAYLTILARAVAPAEYGLLTYSLSWYLFLLPFTFLGADVVLGRELSRRKDAPELLGVTLGTRAVGVILVLVFSLILAFAIEPNAQLRSLVILFSLSLPGRSLWMWGAAAFIAYERSRTVMAFELWFRLLEVVVILSVLHWIGPSLYLIAMIHAASWLLQGFAAAWAVRRRYGLSLGWPNAGWLKTVRDGIPGATFAIAMAAFFQLPIVLFRLFQGTGDELGHFALAYQFVTYLLTIPYVVAYASLPILSRSAQRQDGKDRTAVWAMASLIVLGGIVVGIVTGFAGRPIVTSLFGAGYVAAATVLNVGIWLLIPASLAMLLQQVLFSHAITSRVAAAGPLVGVLTMILLFPFIQLSTEYRSALATVACGLAAWLILVLGEVIRMGFFGARQAVEVDRTC